MNEKQYDFNKLFSMQKVLDDRIIKEKGLEGKDRFDTVILALLVELGELANETRCFKDWSDKGPSAREVILEEFVDGIHFILSLGLMKGFEDVTILQNVVESYKENNLIDQFLMVNRFIYGFWTTTGYPDEYDELFTCYIALGEVLGFSWEEVVAAYERKNEKNHARQDSGIY